MSVQLRQSKYEIRLSALDIPRPKKVKSWDPQASVSLSENKGEPQLIGSTEKIFPEFAKNLEWTTPIYIVYNPEARQKLVITVQYRTDAGRYCDLDKTVASFKVKVSDLVAAKGLPLQKSNKLDKKDGGIISITAEEVFDNVTPYQGFNFKCTALGLDAKDINGASDPYFTISKLRQDGTNPLLIYRSEIHKTNLNPKWGSKRLMINELCNSDLNRQLLIEVWDWDKIGKDDLIGQFTTTMADILGGQTQYNIINPKKQENKKNYQLSGYFHFDVKPTQINVTIAIDLKSHVEPTDPTSLHYINGQTLNEYQEALFKVGSIICPYDADQKFKVYGLGANSESTNHQCLALADNVPGLEPLMETYKEIVPKYVSKGPTQLAPFLTVCSELAKDSKEDGSKIYHVALIITDGNISDQEEAIEALYSANTFPLAIIIVGVGDADFSNMKVLDGGLKNKDGRDVKDLVNFVPFRKYKDDPIGLAEKVLSELPKRLTYYDSYDYKGY